MHYRSFRNYDTPRLAEIWRTCAAKRGFVQPLSAEDFELLVLAKPYFDNRGLVVAEGSAGPVGFAHGGFGPTAAGDSLSTTEGVVSIVVVRPDQQRARIGAELVGRVEDYLRGRGTTVIYGGGTPRLNPFYLGLYGGSQMPGILQSDPEGQTFFASQGYANGDRRQILHRNLSTFRPPVSRRQMQLRRSMMLVTIEDPPALNWWDACTFGCFERTRFELRERTSGQTLAVVLGWQMQPLASSWGVHAVGLTHLWVEPAHRRSGLATYLLSEVFRQLAQAGNSLVELQCDSEDLACLRLAEKLGFVEVDVGIQYVKH